MAGFRKGGCLCGNVTFKVEGEVREVIACHCGQCRKQTGLYYAATRAADAAVEITDGGSLVWFQSSDTSRRGFCSKCGSALFWKRDGDDHISILAGSFDEPSDLKIGRHIFVADKGDFYEITDGLPQFDQSDSR